MATGVVVTGNGPVGSTQNFVDSRMGAMQALVAGMGSSAVVVHLPDGSSPATGTTLGQMVADWIQAGL